jgi:hypothetical protein
MNRKRVILVVSVSIFCLSNFQAFEIGTHAVITSRAIARSVLNPSDSKSIIPVLGFERLDQTHPFEDLAPFGIGVTTSAYYDNSATQNPTTDPNAAEFFPRLRQNLELGIIQRLADRGYLNSNAGGIDDTINSWLIRGAIREDDNDIPYLGYSFGDRDEDPYGNIFRATKHFYDPIGDAAFHEAGFCGLVGCERTNEWAIGATLPLSGAATENNARRNHFTWKDARNNYYWALTLERDDTTSGPGRTAQERRRDAQERKWRWATTITSIGHVIHLLQDTAQPQHTRNDAHSYPILSPLTIDAASDGAFEAYTEARLFGDVGGSNPAANPLIFFSGGKPGADQLPPLSLGPNYPIPSFREPRQFFSTNNVDTDVSVRRGMADYSNRGFFTLGTLPKDLGTSIDVPDFAKPPRPDAFEGQGFYQTVTALTGLTLDGNPVTATEYWATVPDVVAPTFDAQNPLFSVNGGKVPLLRQSNFQLGFDLVGGANVKDAGYLIDYSLMRYHADTLVPRAIAYSAGMINYFFRGRLDIEPIDQKVFAVMN